MNQREKQELDAYITGYHREEKLVIIPAGSELTCPVCDTAFNTKTMLQDEARLVCSNCDASLIVIDGNLEEVEEDIFEDEDEEEEEEEEELDEEPVDPNEGIK